MNAGTIQLPPGLRKVPTGALTVVCVKCTRYGIFQSDDQMLARQDAEAAGWTITIRERDGKKELIAICKKCPGGKG